MPVTGFETNTSEETLTQHVGTVQGDHGNDPTPANIQCIQECT